MKKGDLILIPFPFTDLEDSKKRPALVLTTTNLDVTVVFITTRLKWRTETDVLIKPTDRNGLKKESLIKLNKIATLDQELAIGRLGTLTEKEIKEVNEKLIELFSLK